MRELLIWPFLIIADSEKGEQERAFISEMRTFVDQVLPLTHTSDTRQRCAGELIDLFKSRLEAALIGCRKRRDG